MFALLAARTVWRDRVDGVSCLVAGSSDAKAWMQIADCARGRGEALSLRHVCLVCVDVAGAAGAGLLAVGSEGQRELVCGAGELVGSLEELQVTLGEGPSVWAVDSAGPVLIPDLSAESSQRRWPVFSPAAVELGVQAAFVFPMQVGAVRPGVLSLYRTRPAPLAAQELGELLALTDVGLLLMLNAASGMNADALTWPVDGSLHEDGLLLRQSEVHQAAGIVAVQLDVDVSEAFVRLRAYAFAHDQQLGDLAREVVARRVRFEQDQV